MAALIRSDGSAGDAHPATPRQPQAGHLGVEVDGSAPVGCSPDLQNDVSDAEMPEAGRHASCELQEACHKVLPPQNGALPDWTVPQLD